MKTIVMDTSNTYLALGLFENDQCLEKYQEVGKQRQSEYTITHLQTMLEKVSWDLLDVDTLVITIGPGSYTGQRVALTIAKTLASISNIKVKAVSSLHSYIGNNKGLSIIDARSKKIYVGVYDHNQKVIDDTIINIEDFDSFYQNYQDYPIYGDGQLVNHETKEVDLVNNLYLASLDYPVVEDVDNLNCHYIKDVEAKKICL